MMLILLFIKSSSNKNGMKMSSNFISYESKQIDSSSQILKKPLFMGLDRKEQPFKISAVQAIRYNDDEHIFNLDQPFGEIETSEEKFFIFGKTGIFDNEKQKLFLSGDVEFTNKGSMKFNTTKAEFDFNKQVLSGKNKIIGQQNNSTIKAEGFKVFNRENKIIFTGKSSLTLPQK